jgi:hypothetical protein
MNQVHSATPAPGGTMYTLSGVQAIAGHTISVTNNVSAGSSVTLFPGQSVTFTITYSPTSGFDYSLSNSGNVTITQAATPVTGQAIINLNLLSGISQPVSLTPTGIPTGVAWSFAPTTCNPTCTATLGLTVTPSAVPGTYPITVTGTTVGLPNRTTTFNLVINPPGVFSAVCTVSPSPARVNQQVTWTAIPSGGTPPYTFVWAGTDIVGAPTANPYVHTYSTVGAKFGAASVTDAMGLNVRCAGATVQVSVDPEFQEF